MRVVKHIGARSCATDTSTVLVVVPLFPGEKIRRAKLSAYFASGDSSAIDQPGELNWYGISVPWSLVFATNMMNAGGAPSNLDTVADIDLLYNQYLRDVESDSGEIFGGDVDLDTEIAEGEGTHSDELIDSGPIGVHKWFSREVIMSPLAAEGNTVIRFGDSFFSVVDNVPAHAMGGLTLFGMVRFAATAETNFNVELDDTTSREMMGLLIAGDYTKVKAKIEGDTAATGDFLRTVLFGGDQYVEADTLKGPAGKAIVKSVFHIDSAISRLR